MFLLQLIGMSVQLHVPPELLLRHMQLLFVPSSTFARSSCHVITSQFNSPKFLSLSVDLLDPATFLCLYVVNNLPLASDAFAAFVAFVAFGMLPLVVVHDAACYDVVA